jgi:hypothetical protein
MLVASETMKPGALSVVYNVFSACRLRGVEAKKCGDSSNASFCCPDEAG